ncbi:MAG: hypothetical protein HUU32_12345 [Calditrichaceae bacterium]|nr:hypothetical protein [Calditrichia bacterium]NUQ42179.1 hypothetical protein [Calditrichaceae bacterium]
MARLTKIITLVWVLFGSAALLAQTGAGQEEQEVVAKGLGAIIGGDQAKAADDALASALRSAVEQVVGTMVQSNVLVENYQVVEDQIYSRTQGYVKSYQVLSQTPRDNTIMEVTVRAIVKKSNLENDLNAIGLLIQQKNKPRIMVLVDEKNMDLHYYYDHYDLNTTANQLTNKFLEKGFTFVDKDVVLRKLQRESVQAALEGDTKSAESIARESGAEVLIMGKAVAKEASGGPAVLRQSGMVSCQATLNLRAVRADDGTIIAVTSQQAPAVHVDNVTGGTQALIKAADLAANDLTTKILKVWQQDVYSGTTIQMRVMEVPSFADLSKFREMLKTHVRGVQNVYQREYSGGTALLDLDVRANASQVADELGRKDFSPYRVQVVNFSQNYLVIKLNLIQTEQ